MHKLTTALALFILFALPLAAAQAPAELVPEPPADAEPLDAKHPEAEIEAPTAIDSNADLQDVEPIWEKERVNVINCFECYQSCVARFGEGVQISCASGYGAFCTCYP